MKNSVGCTCIIPVFNEGERILPVLKVISSLPDVPQIICIDDGSTDNTNELIRTHYPEVLLITLEKNQGKSGAIAKGLEKVTQPYVFLMDADLKNLQHHELAKGIIYIITHPEVDMLVFRRKNEIWFSKLVRGDLLVSGERILRTEDLLEIFKEKFSNYQIEPVINYYMQDMKKNVYWVWHSGINVMKFKKVGFFKGWFREMKYCLSVFRYQGLRRYLKNVLGFYPKQAG